MSLNNTAAIEATLAEMEQRRRASIFPAIWQGAAIGVGLGLLVGLFVGAMVICMVILRALRHLGYVLLQTLAAERHL